MTANLDFQAALLHALNSSIPREVVSGVKEVVASKLHELDEHVDVSFTEYFNHSYMPDMVLSWREGVHRHERPVFVRTDVNEGGIAADIHGLIPRSPMIVAIDEASGGASARQAIQEEKRHRQVDLLMTDSKSISAIAQKPDEDVAYDFSRLVTTNFLSGARGFIGEDEAERLQGAFILGAEQDSAEIELSEVIDDFFMPDAAVRLKRSTRLVRNVLAGDFDSLSLSGKFSHMKLRAILPLLLGNAAARENDALWSQLGEVMGLSDIFDISDDLASLELSPLLNANLNHWGAKRAQVTAVVDARGDATGAGEEPLERWSIWRGLLALTTSNWRVLFADDARKLRGRSSDGRVPEWDSVSSTLDHFRVASVELQGVDRRVTLASQEGGDIFGDINAVAGALDEAFYVPRMTVRSTLESQDDAESLVEFSEMLITSSPADSLANLAKAAFNLLLHDVDNESFALSDALKAEVLIEDRSISAPEDTAG